MKKFLTAFIFVICLVSVANAEELITGAFGINLGEPLDLNSVQGEIDDTDCGGYEGCKTYRFGRPQAVRPKIANKLFHSYIVYLASITKTITSIQAYGSDGNCESTIDGAAGIIKEKYGEPHQIINSMSAIRFMWSDINGRTLDLRCGKIEGNHVLIVDYRLNQKEMENARKESSDPSGL